MGIGAICILIACLIISGTTFPWMNSLGVDGFYFMTGVLNILSVLFTYFCIGETKGLSNKQKKSLFIPGGPYGRKLQTGDVIVHHTDQDES